MLWFEPNVAAGAFFGDYKMGANFQNPVKRRLRLKVGENNRNSRTRTRARRRQTGRFALPWGGLRFYSTLEAANPKIPAWTNEL
jgi:hypothetical protein